MEIRSEPLLDRTLPLPYVHVCRLTTNYSSLSLTSCAMTLVCLRRRHDSERPLPAVQRRLRRAPTRWRLAGPTRVTIDDDGETTTAKQSQPRPGVRLTQTVPTGSWSRQQTAGTCCRATVALSQAVNRPLRTRWILQNRRTDRRLVSTIKEPEIPGEDRRRPRWRNSARLSVRAAFW